MKLMKIIILSFLIALSLIKPLSSANGSASAIVAGLVNTKIDNGYYVEGNIKIYAFTAAFEVKKLTVSGTIYNVYGGLLRPLGNAEYGAFNPSVGVGSEGFIARVEYLNSFSVTSDWVFQAGYSHYFKESDFSGFHLGVSRYF